MRILAAALAAVLTLALPAFGQDAEKVKAALRKAIPEAPIDSVRKIQYGGLYEVVIAGDIFYTDERASFIVMGNLIDLKTKENVTEARARQVNKVTFDTLPLDNAIKIVRGNGSRRIAIFEDPNCGYCKRFERDLTAVNDVTMYVFLYPILSQDSLEKTKAIWCSKDPAKAWIDYMVRDIPIPGDGKCNTAAIEKNVAFGREKKINGTPTIFFEDGERVPGVMPIAELEKKMAAARQAAPKVSAK